MEMEVVTSPSPGGQASYPGHCSGVWGQVPSSSSGSSAKQAGGGSGFSSAVPGNQRLKVCSLYGGIRPTAAVPRAIRSHFCCRSLGLLIQDRGPSPTKAPKTNTEPAFLHPGPAFLLPGLPFPFSLSVLLRAPSGNRTPQASPFLPSPPPPSAESTHCNSNQLFTE